jgi:hypothetical protein
MYRQNVTVPPAGSAVQLPLALNDPTGQWTLRVREVATGVEIQTKFDSK